MRMFAQKPKATQQSTSPRAMVPARSYFGHSHEVSSILHLQRTIGNQAVQKLLEANTGDVKGNATTEIGHFGHDFSQIPIHSSEPAGRQPKVMVDTPGNIHTQETDRMTQQAMRVPALPLQRICACGGDCPRCKSEQGSQERSPRDGTAMGLRANEHAAPGLGPRSDGLDDAPYFGPASPTNDAQFGPGTGTGMGCVIGPMRVVTSGALEGGYTVNDYLVGGLSWGNVGSPGTAGVDRTGVKVQLVAAYTGDTSLGVSQTFTFSGANQAFLDSAAQYLGQPPGSVTNGTAINEPVLNAGDHYAHTGWELQYGAKTGGGTPGLVSFADVPRNGPGSKGSVDFRTCFYSRGGPCQEESTCRTWRWTIDFTGANNINTVA